MNHAGLVLKLLDVTVGGVLCDVITGVLTGRVLRVIIDSDYCSKVSSVYQGREFFVISSVYD